MPRTLPAMATTVLSRKKTSTGWDVGSNETFRPVTMKKNGIRTTTVATSSRAVSQAATDLGTTTPAAKAPIRIVQSECLGRERGCEQDGHGQRHMRVVQTTGAGGGLLEQPRQHRLHHENHDGEIGCGENQQRREGADSSPGAPSVASRAAVKTHSSTSFSAA